MYKHTQKIVHVTIFKNPAQQAPYRVGENISQIMSDHRVSTQNTANSFKSTMVTNPQPFKQEDSNGHFPQEVYMDNNIRKERPVNVTLHPSRWLCRILTEDSVSERYICIHHPPIPQQGSHKSIRPAGRDSVTMLISTQMLKKVQNTNYLACTKAKKITHNQDAKSPVNKISAGLQWIKLLVAQAQWWRLIPVLYRVGGENRLLGLFSDLRTRTYH